MFEIAVVVPVGYGGGSIRGAVNTAAQIHDGAAAHGDDVRVRFGYVDIGQASSQQVTFSQLTQRKILAEPIKVDTVDARDIGLRTGVEGPFAVFNNGTDNFDTADFVLVVSDRIATRIAPTYRYGILAYDFIQRYIPKIVDHPTSEEQSRHNWSQASLYLRNYSFAAAVFTTTRQTRRDAISFAGVAAERLCLLPSEFDPVEADATSPASGDARPYLVWTTNASFHKNHLAALAALEAASESDPCFPQILITGVLTDRFRNGDGDPYCTRVAERIKSSDRLSRLVKIVGHVPDEEYVALLSSALLLFHPALFDNGTFAVLEAAWHGVPSVSSDYPAMREISQRFGVPLTFFDPSDPKSMAAVLRAAVADRSRLAAALPCRDHLRRFSPRWNAAEFWAAMRPFVMAPPKP